MYVYVNIYVTQINKHISCLGWLYSIENKKSDGRLCENIENLGLNLEDILVSSE